MWIIDYSYLPVKVYLHAVFFEKFGAKLQLHQNSLTKLIWWVLFVWTTVVAARSFNCDPYIKKGLAELLVGSVDWDAQTPICPAALQ